MFVMIQSRLGRRFFGLPLTVLMSALFLLSMQQSHSITTMVQAELSGPSNASTGVHPSLKTKEGAIRGTANASPSVPANIRRQLQPMDCSRCTIANFGSIDNTCNGFEPQEQKDMCLEGTAAIKETAVLECLANCVTPTPTDHPTRSPSPTVSASPSNVPSSSPSEAPVECKVCDQEARKCLQESVPCYESDVPECQEVDECCKQDPDDEFDICTACHDACLSAADEYCEKVFADADAACEQAASECRLDCWTKSPTPSPTAPPTPAPTGYQLPKCEPCNTDVECLSLSCRTHPVWNTGYCYSHAIGQPCQDAFECESNYCVDGICEHFWSGVASCGCFEYGYHPSPSHTEDHCLYEGIETSISEFSYDHTGNNDCPDSSRQFDLTGWVVWSFTDGEPSVESTKQSYRLTLGCNADVIFDESHLNMFKFSTLQDWNTPLTQSMLEGIDITVHLQFRETYNEDNREEINYGLGKISYGHVEWVTNGFTWDFRAFPATTFSSLNVDGSYTTNNFLATGEASNDAGTGTVTVKATVKHRFQERDS